MTTKMAWRLVERLAAALDANERDAVLGDQAESGESGGRAALDIFGLVVRREIAMWRDWRPWVILATLIVPFSILISVLSRMVSGETSVYFWMYLNNWDWDLLRNSGFWHELPSAGFVVLKNCLTLACWSWGIGFAVGLASRRTLRANGILFCFMLLFGEAVGAPLYLAYFFRAVHLAAAADLNDPVSALMFYRVLFPLLVQVLLVVVACLLGARQGASAKAHKDTFRAVLSVAAIVALAAIVIQAPGFMFVVKAYERPWIWRSWGMQMLPFVAYWPVAYLLANIFFTRFRNSFEN